MYSSSRAEIPFWKIDRMIITEQEKNSGRRKTENCCYFSGMKLRERFVAHENLMSTSTWTEGESGIGSELLRSTIPPENATSSEWNTKFKDRPAVTAV
jgi:hypothetical protein